MLAKSTVDFENYIKLKRLNQPRTEQINFNRRLNEVAAHKYQYSNPKLCRKDLKATICSEPLPCTSYCLPKDYKDGDLKSGPTHAAVDTPATPLSKYLAKALQPLLKHVPAHLRNTEEFVDFLSNVDGESVHEFCSLDVSSLYGSIPLEDLSDNTPSVFAVAANFFLKAKSRLWSSRPK